jgi:hypothetical protein
LNALNGPNAVIVDDVNQKVYVSDGNNNRILRYNSTQALIANNSFAELILFGNGTGGLCANSTLTAPEQIDYLGTDLYVADFGQNRVFKIAGAPSATVTVPAATTTFGHLNASDCSGSGTLKDFVGPTGVAITLNGTLFISENGAAGVGPCYIKRFDNANNASNYPAPSSLLGNGSCISVANNSLSNNAGYLSVDYLNGHLFAADTQWNRVLLFKQAHLKANLSGADVVFGQSVFTTNTSACGASALSAPYGVFYDLDNDVLIVGDNNNSRVVFFDSPIAAASGANITFVVGQANTSVCAAGSTSQSTFKDPTGVFYSPDFPGVFLLAADFTDNRILRFQCSNTTFSRSVSFSQTIAASLNASSVVANASLNASSAVANATLNASSVVAGNSSIAASSAVVNASSVAASSVIPSVAASSIVNTTTGTTSASQSNTPSQTGTASASRSSSRTGTNSKTATSLCGNGVKEPTEQCEGGACCSHRCRFYRANRPCGFRPSGTAKACIKKRRCNGLGVCRPAVIKQNPKRKCKKADGSKGLCDITTGACI